MSAIDRDPEASAKGTFRVHDPAPLRELGHRAIELGSKVIEAGEDAAGVESLDGIEELASKESAEDSNGKQNLGLGDNRSRETCGLLDILRRHIATQLRTPEQETSELLFPAEDGGFRSRSALKKPFVTVATALGLKKHVSPKAIRRTFQNIARALKARTS